MKNKSLSNSFRNAWQGVRHAAAHERNFKIHITLAILAVACCIAFRVEIAMFLWVVYAIFSVLSMELLNTAVEAVTDLVCGQKQHPLAKIAKDTAAGAVLLSAVQAVVVAAVVAVSVINRWLNG